MTTTNETHARPDAAALLQGITPGDWHTARPYGKPSFNLMAGSEVIGTIFGFLGSPVACDREGEPEANCRLAQAAPALAAEVLRLREALAEIADARELLTGSFVCDFETLQRTASQALT